MKTQIRFIRFISIITAAVLIISITACAKKSGDIAVVVALIGKAELIKPNDKPKQLKVKDTLEKNDVVKTEADSFLSIQVGNSSMVNLMEKTSLKISSLEKSKEFFLDQGKVFSKIVKLEKGAAHTMYTKTTTAAVRGTDFSVYAGEKETVVAVNDGKILVKKTSDTGKDEEKIVDKGNTAVVTEKIETRSITIEEKKEFQKVEEMSPKIIDKEPEKKVEDVKKETEVKKEIQIPASGNADIILVTSKPVFNSVEPINVDYINMPESRYVWLSLANLSSPGGSHITYNWTYGNKNGRMTFEDLKLEPGTYEIRAHFNRSNNIDKKITFTVIK
jgi:hypothetical protein